MTGANSPGKDKKFKSTKSQEVFPKQHLPENSDMFTIQKKGLVFLFLVVSFLMRFSNLPSFYMIIYIYGVFVGTSKGFSKPSNKNLKGEHFFSVKRNNSQKDSRAYKGPGPRPLSVNDNAMLDACATATRAFDTQDDSHGDAGTLIVFGAPTYLGLFCHFFWTDGTKCEAND